MPQAHDNATQEEAPTISSRNRGERTGARARRFAPAWKGCPQ